jgi:hypothetical protein
MHRHRHRHTHTHTHIHKHRRHGIYLRADSPALHTYIHTHTYINTHTHRRHGIYLRADSASIHKYANPNHIHRVESDVLRFLRQTDSDSVSVFYDACSFIHMWASVGLREGINAAMAEIVRSLKPGGCVCVHVCMYACMCMYVCMCVYG